MATVPSSSSSHSTTTTTTKASEPNSAGQAAYRAFVATQHAFPQAQAPTKPAHRRRGSNHPTTPITAPTTPTGTTQLLFELDRALAGLSKRDTAAFQRDAETLLLHTVIPTCAGYLAQHVAASALVTLYRADSHRLSAACKALIAVQQSPSSAAAGFTCFGAMAEAFGFEFIDSVPEFVTIVHRTVRAGAKASANSSDPAAIAAAEVRVAAMRALARVCVGTRGPIRNETRGNTIVNVESELHKLIARATADPASRVRRAAASCLATSFRLASDARDADTFLPFVVKNLNDPSLDARTRLTFVHALGFMLHLVVRIATTDGANGAGSSPRRPGKHFGRVRTLDDAIRVLGTLFVRATTPPLRAGVAHAVVVFFKEFRSATDGGESSPSTVFVPDKDAGRLMSSFLGFLGKGKPVATTKGAWQSVRCMSHAIKYGLLASLSDRGLEFAAEQLLALLLVHTGNSDTPLEDDVTSASSSSTESAAAAPDKASSFNTYQLATCLGTLSTIFGRLGTAVAGLEMCTTASQVLRRLLAAHNSAVRMFAAQTLRQLARSSPSSLNLWISASYSNVVIQLVEAAAAPDELDVPLFCSLHGHAQALVALVGVVREVPGGIPVPLLESMFDVANKLLNLPLPTPSSASSPVASGRRRGAAQPRGVGGGAFVGMGDGVGSDVFARFSKLHQSGWQLIGALITVGTEWIGTRLNPLFALWKSCLTRKTSVQATRSGGIANQRAHVHDFRLRYEAMVALRSFVHIFGSRLVFLSSGAPSAVLKPTSIFARLTFTLVKQAQDVLQSVRAAKEDGSGAGSADHGTGTVLPQFVTSLQALKEVVLDVLCALPPSTFSSSFVSILHSIVTDFTSVAPPATSLMDSFAELDDAVLDTAAGGDGADDDSIADRTISIELSQVPLVELRSFVVLCAEAPACVVVAGCINRAVVDWPDYTQNWCFWPDTHGHRVHGCAGSSQPFAQRSRWNGADARLRDRPSVLLPVPIRLVDASIRLFSSMFAEQTAHHQEQLLNHFGAIVEKGVAVRALHSPIIYNIAATLLAIARELHARQLAGLAFYRSEKKKEIKNSGSAFALPSKCLVVWLSMAGHLLGSSEARVRRAVAESLSLIAGLHGDTVAQRAFAVAEAKVRGGNVSVVSGAVFLLGALHRRVGGMTTLRYLPFTLAALQALSRQQRDPFRFWILHALWLAVDTGSFTVEEHLAPALGILYSQLDFAPSSGLHALVIRILLSILRAIGPSLAQNYDNPGSDGDAVREVLNLVRHVRADAGADILSQDRTAEAELLLCVHELLVWIPPNRIKEADADDIVAALGSESAIVRNAALKCARVWASKDANFCARLPLALLHVIDATRAEQNLSGVVGVLVELMHMTVRGVASANQGAGADGWLDLLNSFFDACKRAVTARLPSDAQLDDDEDENRGEGSGDEDDDDDDGNVSRGGGGGADATGTGDGAAEAQFRCHTKVAAVDCLIAGVREALMTVPGQFVVSAAAAKRSSRNDKASRRRKVLEMRKLAYQFQDLVTVACRAVGASQDSLRLAGMRLLRVIISGWAHTEDPHAPGQLYLEVMQAQVTSSLRQCLKGGVTGPSRAAQGVENTEASISPLLRIYACDVVALFLRSGMTKDDVVSRRLVAILMEPVRHPPSLRGWLADFDGGVTTAVVLAHLSSLAELHFLCEVHVQEITALQEREYEEPTSPTVAALARVRTHLQPEYAFLAERYASVLDDLCVVSSISRRALQEVSGFAFDGSLVTGVDKIIERNAGIIVKAAAMCLRTRAELPVDVLVVSSAADVLSATFERQLRRREAYTGGFSVVERVSPLPDFVGGGNELVGLSEESDTIAGDMSIDREHASVLGALWALKEAFDQRVSLLERDEVALEVLSLLGWVLHAHAVDGALDCGAQSGMVALADAWWMDIWPAAEAKVDVASAAPGHVRALAAMAVVQAALVAQSKAASVSPLVVHRLAELVTGTVHAHLPRDGVASFLFADVGTDRGHTTARALATACINDALIRASLRMMGALLGLSPSDGPTLYTSAIIAACLHALRASPSRIVCDEAAAVVRALCRRQDASTNAFQAALSGLAATMGGLLEMMPPPSDPSAALRIRDTSLRLQSMFRCLLALAGRAREDGALLGMCVRMVQHASVSVRAACFRALSKHLREVQDESVGQAVAWVGRLAGDVFWCARQGQDDAAVAARELLRDLIDVAGEERRGTMLQMVLPVLLGSLREGSPDDAATIAIVYDLAARYGLEFKTQAAALPAVLRAQLQRSVAAQQQQRSAPGGDPVSNGKKKKKKRKKDKKRM